MPTLEHRAPVAEPPPSRGGARVWVEALLDLVFPPFCPVCQERLGKGRRDPLCGACWARLERIEPPQCRTCGLPLAGPAGSGVAPLCGPCRRHPPPFAYARSAVLYGEVAREAVHAFKFRAQRALAAPLGDLLAEMDVAGLAAVPAALLIPVPLHPGRLRERGFNQAYLLAKRLGRAHGVPVSRDVLVRIEATSPQTELSGPARRANVKDAFAVRHPERVRGRHVIVVDDVFTTGATAAACARCLKKAGAAAVGVLTVTRVV